MITAELLAQTTVLAALTEEQRAAIIELSRNDENAVIGKRVGELHGQYDQDILGVTGVKKKDGEKSYDYMKRVLGDYKAKAESVKGVKAELDAANVKVAELKATIEKGSADETLRKELKDTKARAAQLQDQLKARDTEFAAEKARHEAAMRDTHLDYAFQAAAASLKFKDGVTDTVRGVLLDSAKAEILAKGTPDFTDGKLVFRDKDGNVLNNQKNSLNPYTLQELIMESSIKDMIDTGRKVTGGGTGPANDGSGGGSGTLDLSGVKTQVEADRMIEEHLLASGLTRDSREFAEQAFKMRTDADVSGLPIR